MRVLIAGGGIGGMTAALCCLHFGHDVVLFEQAAELGEVGAGLQIPPNAMKVFNALGIEDLIAKNAFRPAAIEARMGKSGRHILRSRSRNKPSICGARPTYIFIAPIIYLLWKRPYAPNLRTSYSSERMS